MHQIIHLVVISIAATSLYIHPQMLNGDFVYDDGGTITGNPVTLGHVPFSDVWKKDYWGKDDIDSEQSHKSYRPITSITFTLNAMYSQSVDNGEVKTYGFHVVNVFIHLLVSMLMYPTTLLAFRGLKKHTEMNLIKQLNHKDEHAAFAASLLFAVHPVHSEAVQNITGRAELLMAFFFLSGFLVYAKCVVDDETQYHLNITCKTILKDKNSNSFLMHVFPRIFVFFNLAIVVPGLTCLSFLSKEMGATLPMLCSFWDFFQVSHLSLIDLLKIPFLCFSSFWNEEEIENKEYKEDKEVNPEVTDKKEEKVDEQRENIKQVDPSIHQTNWSISKQRSLSRWLVRTTILAVTLSILLIWRIGLNGGYDPIFRYNTNRQGIETFKTSWAQYDKDLEQWKLRHTQIGGLVGENEFQDMPVKPSDYVAPHEIIGEDEGVHGLLRILSIMAVWCHYLQICFQVRPLLSPDWSGDSEPLVKTFNPLEDLRIFKIILLVAAFLFMFRLGFLNRDRSPYSEFAGRLLTCGAFYAFPFLLSANILIIVGTTVAERVAYLPSVGVAMCFGLFLGSGPMESYRPFFPFYYLIPFSPSPPPHYLLSQNDKEDSDNQGRNAHAAAWRLSWRSGYGRWAVLLLMLMGMTQKCVERNFAWTNQVELWAAAYAVNPTSSHTCHNYGVNLSINNGVRKALQVLKEAGSMPRAERVDADEIYPTLAMCQMATGDLQGGLETLAYGWNEIELEIDAMKRGVKIYYMHTLMSSQGRDNLRKGRLLAVQATLLKSLDAKEAASAALMASRLAGQDPLVLRLVFDLETYFSSRVGYHR